MDAGGHALKAAADEDDGAALDPGAEFVRVLNKQILDIAAVAWIAGEGAVEARQDPGGEGGLEALLR